MEAATVAALSHDCPNIIAVKEASGRFDQATAILKSKRADFAALSGEDALLLPLMSLGFEGVISVIANVLPNDYACLVKSALQEIIRLPVASIWTGPNFVKLYLKKEIRQA